MTTVPLKTDAMQAAVYARAELSLLEGRVAEGHAETVAQKTKAGDTDALQQFQSGEIHANWPPAMQQVFVRAYAELLRHGAQVMADIAAAAQQSVSGLNHTEAAREATPPGPGSLSQRCQDGIAAFREHIASHPDPTIRDVTYDEIDLVCQPIVNVQLSIPGDSPDYARASLAAFEKAHAWFGANGFTDARTYLTIIPSDYEPSTWG